MSEEQKKKRTEGSWVKAKVTCFKTYLKSDGVNLSELKRRLDKLNNALNYFEVIQNAIEELNECKREQNKWITFKNEFFALVGEADDRLLQLNSNKASLNKSFSKCNFVRKLICQTSSNHTSRVNG
jgi:hypothetical protein